MLVGAISNDMAKSTLSNFRNFPPTGTVDDLKGAWLTGTVDDLNGAWPTGTVDDLKGAPGSQGSGGRLPGGQGNVGRLKLGSCAESLPLGSRPCRRSPISLFFR